MGAFETAKSGGRNHGLYIQLSAQTDEQLLRSIRSYEKNIEKHREKINEPGGYVDNWETRSPEYKSGMIKKWQKDILRNKEQLDVAIGASDERGLRYE